MAGDWLRATLDRPFAVVQDLIAHETQTTKTVAQMCAPDAWLEQNIPSFHLPLFILHGTAAKTTKPEGSQFLPRGGPLQTRR